MTPQLKKTLLLILMYVGGALDYFTDFLTVFADELNIKSEALLYVRIAMWVTTALYTAIQTGLVKQLRRRFKKNAI